MPNRKQISILGIRGIPASHGGFETFAEILSLYLNKHGWDVTVYCQSALGGQVMEDDWNGIHRVHVPVANDNALSTINFDYKSTLLASRHDKLILLLGYNTAVFAFLLRLKSKKIIINMDGIEWKRAKWNWYERAWLYINERAGCWLGHKLIADHPEIKRHLMSLVAEDKIVMIPYGGREVSDADEGLLKKYELQPKSYAIIIARPEPENNILEIVRAFSKCHHNTKLVVLGAYKEDSEYHLLVRSSAGQNVRFLGAIYDHKELDALRYYSSLYIHGHTVGGTNPSLVEALASGQPVLAHDNKYNRWVAGESASYFVDEEDCARMLNHLLSDDDLLHKMSSGSRERYQKVFTWESVLSQYHELLLQWL